MEKSDTSVKAKMPTCSPGIHPTISLIQGKVNYKVKFMGCTEVQFTFGSENIKGAIFAIQYANEKSGTPAKAVKVEISISVAEVQVMDGKTNMLLHHHDLQNILFWTEEDPSIFAYIATVTTDKSKKNICYAFFAESSISKDVVSTIGQAFDVALFLHREKESPKVKALEEEIKSLKNEIMLLQCKCTTLGIEKQQIKNKYDFLIALDSKSPPLPPRTPVPRTPNGFPSPESGSPFFFSDHRSLKRATSLDYSKTDEIQTTSLMKLSISSAEKNTVEEIDEDRYVTVESIAKLRKQKP